MSKILIGAATAAMWFVLSYAAHADGMRGRVCDGAKCIAISVDRLAI